MRSFAAQYALQPRCGPALYKTWGRVGLSAIGPAGAVATLILIGVSSGGCSMSRVDAAFAKMEGREPTGALGAAQAGGPAPTEGDLAFARNAASDVLTRATRIPASPGKIPRPARGAR